MSELRTHSLRHNTATGDPNIEMYADGSTSIRSLQNFAKSIARNGGMAVAQRGTTSDQSGTQTVDGTGASWSQGAVDQSQETVNPTHEPFTRDGISNYYRITNTTGSQADNSSRQFVQTLEAQIVRASGWNYRDPNSNLTISFWFRSSLSQVFNGYLRMFDGTSQGRSFRIAQPDGTAVAANTWTHIVVTVPGNANITVDNNVGAGMQVAICGFLGADFTDAGNAMNAWAGWNGASRTPVMQNDWSSTNGSTLDITGLQITPTDNFIGWINEDYGVTLAKCQRYFNTNWDRSYSLDDSQQTRLNLMLPWAASPNTNSASSEIFLYHFPVTMRANPVVTIVAPDGTAGEFFLNGSNNVASRGLDGTTTRARIFLNGSGTFGSGVVNASADL